MKRVYGRSIKRDGIVSRVYTVTSTIEVLNFWRKQANLAYVCLMEVSRKDTAHVDQMFLASQTCKQLLGITETETKAPLSVLHNTPHDEAANERFLAFVRRKGAMYFKSLIQVYGELITAFSDEPTSVTWDSKVYARYVMTLELRGKILISMRLQISEDRTRSNHNFIARSLSEELRPIFDNTKLSPKGLAIELHKAAAQATLEMYPSVRRVEILNPFPEMIRIFERFGLYPPYTPEKLAMTHQRRGYYIDPVHKK